jgi:broad specificity phosphatase PhoE
MDTRPKTEFLKTITWGKPAIQLLANCNKLTQGVPAQMVLRHSERISIEKQSEISSACLTETGKEAARAFGIGLPKNRIIRVFHSPVTRCRDTAAYIREGAKSSGRDVKEIIELAALDVGPSTDSNFWSDIIRDWPHSFNYWLCGRYNPADAEPSLDYSKRIAGELEHTSSGVASNTLDLYVTHDMALISMLFHWFGVLPGSDLIGFLNGFLMQMIGNKISLFVGDSSSVLDYPYWWDHDRCSD